MGKNSKSHSNIVSFRKWLYNFLHEDKRELRTRIIVMVEGGETACAYRKPKNSHSYIQDDKCKDSRNSNVENIRNQVLNSKLHCGPPEFAEIMKDNVQGRICVAAISIFQENSF